jgi:hypothetical protein
MRRERTGTLDRCQSDYWRGARMNPAIAGKLSVALDQSALQPGST